jgi:cation diffusion facilitator family transporter
MHIQTMNRWQHNHEFSMHNQANEKRTLTVVIFTAGMMVFEILGGYIFGSMALLADGWHMGTHAAALGLTMFAYWYTRKQARNPRYTFGTGKVNVLGGFSSAIILQIIAVLMMIESAQRLINPQTIRYTEAIIVAIIGLVVNLVCVRLLGDHHSDEEAHQHKDHNLKAAYFHVLADALTSVLAIAALIAGRSFGWAWMDALMGIVGGVLISRWAIGLLRETGHILLDGSTDDELIKRIKTTIESEADSRISDLHVWKISDHSSAAILSLVTHFPRPVEHYRNLLSVIPNLLHVTIEINPCTDEPCLPTATYSIDKNNNIT